MSRCAIVDDEDLLKLIHRYNGIGKELNNDEREILLFALYNDSKNRGGLAFVAEARVAAGFGRSNREV
jgi:hypothetical protein